MQNNKKMTSGFFEEVTYHGRRWTLHIRHFLVLTEEDRIRYNVCDGQFLVHMYSIEQSNVFKVFLDDEEPLIWRTDASPLMVDKEMVEVIGTRIDLKHDLQEGALPMMKKDKPH